MRTDSGYVLFTHDEIGDLPTTRTGWERIVRVAHKAAEDDARENNLRSVNKDPYIMIDLGLVAKDDIQSDEVEIKMWGRTILLWDLEINHMDGFITMGNGVEIPAYDVTACIPTSYIEAALGQRRALRLRRS